MPAPAVLEGELEVRRGQREYFWTLIPKTRAGTPMHVSVSKDPGAVFLPPAPSTLDNPGALPV